MIVKINVNCDIASIPDESPHMYCIQSQYLGCHVWQTPLNFLTCDLDHGIMYRPPSVPWPYDNYSRDENHRVYCMNNAHDIYRRSVRSRIACPMCYVCITTWLL